MKLALVMSYREISRLARAKRFHLRRVGAVATISLPFFAELSSKNTELGLHLFQGYSYVAFFLLLIWGIVATFTAISKEKEEGTLELMLLTDFTTGDIIFGKFLSQMFAPLLIYCSTLPLAMFCIGVGGISVSQILATFAVIIASTLIVGALGMYFSTITSSRNTAAISSAVLALYVIGGSALDDVINSPFPVSPLTVLSWSLEEKNIAICYYYATLQIAITLLLLLLSNKVLAKVSFAPGRLKKIIAKVGKNYRVPLCKGNPVAWLEYHRKYGGDRTWTRMSLICLLLIVIGVCVGGELPAIVFTLLAVFTFLYSFALSLRSFAYNQKDRTLEFLLITKLSSHEILVGKVAAIFVSACPLVISTIIMGIYLSFLAPLGQTFLTEGLFFLGIYGLVASSESRLKNFLTQFMRNYTIVISVACAVVFYCYIYQMSTGKTYAILIVAFVIAMYMAAICSCAMFASLKYQNTAKAFVAVLFRVFFWFFFSVLFLSALFFLSSIIMIIFYLNATSKNLKIESICKS